MGWRHEWTLNLGSPNTEAFLTTGQFQHDVWRLLRKLHSEGLPSLWQACLYVLAFFKVAARELYVFATADTCDGSLAALFFGALCAYLLIVRSRDRQRELEEATARAKGPPIRVSPALAGEAFWDKYEKARGWQSNIGGNEKASQLVGGKNPYSRPLDAMLPRREYVPKKRAWEGSGTASIEGAPAPLLRGEAPAGRQDVVEAAAIGDGKEGGKGKEAVDWERTRKSASTSPEVWAEELPYAQWMETYRKNFQKAGSLAAAGMLLDALGSRHGLLEVNRQFYRDVTSGGMIQLENRPVPCRDAVEKAVKRAKKQLASARRPAADVSDTYDHHIARFAWDGLVRLAGGDEAFAREVSSVANQNLGIACYEHLVNHFAQGGDGGDEPLAVLQTGVHMVNIWRDDSDPAAGAPWLKVRFQGLFKLVPFSLLNSLGVGCDPRDDASLARAVAATAELRVPLPASAEDEVYAAARAEGVARFAIHAPVKTEVVPEGLLLAVEVASDEVQEVWVREWLEVKLGLGDGSKAAGMVSRGGARRAEVSGRALEDAAQEDVGKDRDDGECVASRVAAEGSGSGGGDGERDQGRAGGAVWGDGKQRLLMRLMAEGFRFEASMRAVAALSSSSSSAAAAAAEGVEVGRGSLDAKGASAVGASKSTAKLVDCLLWLCERLGDPSVNEPLCADDLAQLQLSPADLVRIRAAAIAAALPGDAAAGAARCGQEQLAQAQHGAVVAVAGELEAASPEGQEAGAGSGAGVGGLNMGPPVGGNPWRVLEKASEAAAEAAAKKVRDEALQKRRARAQQRGFNKGYQS